MAAMAERLETDTVGAGMRRRLVGFVHTLRDNGFAVGLGRGVVVDRCDDLMAK